MDARAPAALPPVILVVSADEQVRESLLVPLRRRYAEDYRIVDADGPASAVAAIEELPRSTAADLALVLADDASPVADHESVFAAARRSFPDVRRGPRDRVGVVGRPATADAVLELMTRVQIDYYVVRPVHSPDESFHRAVTDFLREWEASAGKRHRGFTVIGEDAQPRTHVLRSRLARGGVPSDHLDPSSPDAVSMLAAAGVEYAGVPLVRTADGRVLVDPDDAELARAYGLETSLPDRDVDARRRRGGAGRPGGGGVRGIRGARHARARGRVDRRAGGVELADPQLPRVLARRLGRRARAARLPAGVGVRRAVRAHPQGVGHAPRRRRVRARRGRRRRRAGPRRGARVGRHAIGGSPRPGLQPFVGASVFYGASSVEARAQSGRDVLVVGGGNSAGQAALHLARYARSVSLVVRGPSLAASMSRYLIDQLDAAGVGLDHRGARSSTPAPRPRPTGSTTSCSSAPTPGERTTVPADAVFITIGARPHTEWLAPEVLRDQWGSVITGPDVLAEGGRRAWLGGDDGPDAARVVGAGLLRGRRRAPRVGQARGVGGRRGIGRDLRRCTRTSARTRAADRAAIRGIRSRQADCTRSSSA